MSDTEITPGGPPPALPNSVNSISASAGVLPGTPLYPSAANANGAPTVSAARGNVVGTAYPVGLALNPAGVGDKVGYRYSGPLTLPIAEWAAVLDTGTQLTPGVPYYVSDATAGKLTLTRPVASSQFVSPVGVASSHNTMIINCSLPVQNGA